MEPGEAHEGAEPESRPPPGARQVFALLRRNRDFRLLYAAQLISFAGDWFLFVALAGLIYDLTGSPGLVAGLIVALTVPFALLSVVAGPLADRLDRRALMVGADLARGTLALGFFLVDSKADIWLVYTLVGAISGLGALFEPASSAAIPNVVDRDELAAANVLTSSAWGTMLAVGAGIGGLVVAAFGREAGYIGDAVSFFLSAVLLLRIRRQFAEAREPGHEHPGLVEATRETVLYARRDHRVLALLSVKGGFGLSVGVIGLLPVLALDVFDAGDAGTGILYGFRGLGAFIGPFLFRWFVRDDDLHRLFWGIAIALSSYGVFYAFAPFAPTLLVASLCVMAGHFGGGGQWSLSTYGLQRLVPDHIRGRVFAFDYGLVTMTLAGSSAAAGWAADAVGVRVVILGLACVGIAFGLAWTAATATLRRSLQPGPVEPAGPVEPVELASRPEAPPG
jgi:MFS family permease